MTAAGTMPHSNLAGGANGLVASTTNMTSWSLRSTSITEPAVVRGWGTTPAANASLRIDMFDLSLRVDAPTGDGVEMMARAAVIHSEGEDQR